MRWRIPAKNFIIVCGLALGCSGEHERLMKEKYPSYPGIIKHAIDRGYPIAGMDYDQVYLALGEPVCKKTVELGNRPVEVWLFPPAGRDPCATPDFRVFFEQGVVTGWEDRRTLPLLITPNPGAAAGESQGREDAP